MSTTDALTFRDAAAEAADFEYRPLSTGAIASVVFGALSTLVFVAGKDSFEASLMLCPLPLIGLVLGLRSLRRITAQPGQMTGAKLAALGTGLSAACLVGGLAFSGYVYATELPDGYNRISFTDLRPNEVDLRGDHAVSSEIAQLDGKKVFIKGYFRPGTSDRRINATQFLLVRDNNQCCFGDLSDVKYYDQVKVSMGDRLSVDYSTRLFRVGGVLRVSPENALLGLGAPPVFALEADHVQ